MDYSHLEICTVLYPRSAEVSRTPPNADLSQGSEFGAFESLLSESFSYENTKWTRPY